MAVKPTKPDPQQVHSEGLSQGQMTGTGWREDQVASPFPSFLSAPRRETVDRKRQLLAQASQPGAQSSTLLPTLFVHHQRFREAGRADSWILEKPPPWNADKRTLVAPHTSM